MLKSSSSLSIHTTTLTNTASNNNIMNYNETAPIVDDNDEIESPIDRDGTNEKQQRLPIATTMLCSSSRYTLATKVENDTHSNSNNNNRTILPPSPPSLSPPYVEHPPINSLSSAAAVAAKTTALNEDMNEYKQVVDIINNELDNDSPVKGRLRSAIDALSMQYTMRYNALLQSFENLESVHRNMIHEMVYQQAHYDKAVREMRFYKSKYGVLQRQKREQQQKPSAVFLDDDAIFDWQRRISSSTNHHPHHHSRHPANNNGNRTPIQRNMSLVSENESYCGSSASSSLGWTCSSAGSSIHGNFPFLPPQQHANNPSSLRSSIVELDYSHPLDTSNLELLLLQDNNENQTIDLMSVLAMSSEQLHTSNYYHNHDREIVSASSAKYLPLETVVAEPNTPPPPNFLPPPPPNYPPSTAPVTPTDPSAVTTVIPADDGPTKDEEKEKTNVNEKDSISNNEDNNSNSNNEKSTTDPIMKMRSMPLAFACGDGFWNTIARGKNNKVEVDSLISNYLRRGGQPNVAKNSATIKSVKEGYGLIHALISVKNGSALSRVVEAGANPNIVTLSSEPLDRVTPLVLAAQLNYLTGVRILLERARADIFQRGPSQVTALHMALEHGADDALIMYLVRASKHALLDIVDVEGATPLHYACKYGRVKVMILFIRECHVQLDPRDNKGETPLHYAVRQRRLKVITRLLGDFGVYPNHYVVKQTPTPLDLAKSGGFKSISEYLRSMGAKTTKEMEKAANRGSFTSGSSGSSIYNSSNKEVISFTSGSGITLATSSTTNSSGINGTSSGIKPSSTGGALGTTSFSSSIISGTTTISSSRRSVVSTLSGTASIHSNSNDSTISRDSGNGSFSLSGATLNLRNRLFSNHH